MNYPFKFIWSKNGGSIVLGVGLDERKDFVDATIINNKQKHYQFDGPAEGIGIEGMVI